MNTKQLEILTRIANKYGYEDWQEYMFDLHTNSKLESAIEAMDIYAKEYGIWIRQDGWEWSFFNENWFNPSKGIPYTTGKALTDNELYQQFLNDTK